MTEAFKSQESVFNLLKNKEAIKKIEEKISYRYYSLIESDFFNKTQRKRSFFKIYLKGGQAIDTYWDTLFFPFNTKTTRVFAKKILNNKTIVLLGGGRSQLKKELQENDIIPHEIVNVDPFVKDIEEGADPVIPISASDVNFIEKMQQQGIQSADEIWAVYSVPAYLKDPKEIHQLIQNIDELLAPGGSARIWPIEVSGEGKEPELFARKNALIESIKNINEINKYEITLYESAGRPGFILYKLAPSEKELQKEKDQEKIRKIRKELGL
ncbi:MAG: hypothetical protein ABH808_03590 [Candidatus Kuenenbacteria bacterium]